MDTEISETHLLPIARIDAMLAQHPFGDSVYITRQMHLSYLRRLEKLSTRLPIAGRLLQALLDAEPQVKYRMLGDTVIRCAVQHAQVQVETGAPYGLPMALCEEVFAETVRAIDEGRHAPLGARLKHRIGRKDHHGWVWDEDCEDSVFKRALHHILALDYGTERPCTPAAEQTAMLATGAYLLGILLPASCKSALSHTHTVVVFPEAGVWQSRLSSSEFRISGTVFLSRRVLNNPWTVAEHLYHESLHQQFYDIRAGHFLLQQGFMREGAPLIHSPWNRPDATRNSFWDIHRALAAFHVYAHLALLCTAADQDETLQERFGPVRMVGRRTSLVRAHYLAEQIRKVAWDELGPAGQRFADWFESLLELLDASPPAPGADAHLLLDRYWREATSVRNMPLEQRPRITECVRRLIDDEVKRARQVLAEMRKDTMAFDQALAAVPDQDPVEYFSSVRTLVATTILRESPPSFRLSESGVPDRLVKQMVEESSEILRPLLDNAPRQQRMEIS